RYWRNCQKSTLNFRYDPTHYGRMAMVDIEFLSGDPFQYEVATQSASQVISATPTTFNVTGVGGNASALPVISITIGATGTLAATITNNT
ncbi:hypothetical protein, partial [Salmonella enterica]|uniref:hypothetical protein n=1 Tax=Salmonella enterica TaxID=28901 RepID=UPI003D2DAC63